MKFIIEKEETINKQVNIQNIRRCYGEIESRVRGEREKVYQDRREQHFFCNKAMIMRRLNRDPRSQ